MSKLSNKVISYIFLFIICICGIGTIKNCSSDLKNKLSNKDLKESIDIIETSIQDNFNGRNSWININGLFQKVVGTTILYNSGDLIVYNDIIKLNNEQIIYSMEYRDNNEINKISRNIEKFEKYLKSKSINLIYTQLPCKIDETDKYNTPIGAHLYANDNSNRLIKNLEEKNISVLDIRKILHEQNINYKKIFFNTDHHWKPEAGLASAGFISDILRKEYGFEINTAKYYNISNYNIKEYKNWFLGSLGKRVGTLYAGVDDFNVITPKFNTNFYFYADTSNGKKYKNGDFANVMLEKANLKKDYFNISTYSTYIGGDYKENIIKNNISDNNKKILLLRDSFSCVMAPYLALGCKELRTIDLRYYKENLIDYINKYNPNVVIIAYSENFWSEWFDFDL